MNRNASSIVLLVTLIATGAGAAGWEPCYDLLDEERHGAAFACFYEEIRRQDDGTAGEDRARLHAAAAAVAFEEARLLDALLPLTVAILADYYETLERYMQTGTMKPNRKPAYYAGLAAYAAGDYEEARARFASVREEERAGSTLGALVALGEAASEDHLAPLPGGGLRVRLPGDGAAEGIRHRAAAYILDLRPGDRTAMDVLEDAPPSGALSSLARHRLVLSTSFDEEAPWPDLPAVEDAAAPASIDTIRTGEEVRRIEYFDPTPLFLRRELMLRLAERLLAGIILPPDVPSPSPDINCPARSVLARVLVALDRHADALGVFGPCEPGDRAGLLPDLLWRTGREGESKSAWARISSGDDRRAAARAACRLAEAGATFADFPTLIEKMLGGERSIGPGAREQIMTSLGRVAAAAGDREKAERWLRLARGGLSAVASASPRLVLEYDNALFRLNREGYRFIMRDLRTLEQAIPHVRPASEAMEILYARYAEDQGWIVESR